MEKKTIDTLRVMLCGEIEEIAKKGTLSHESLDVLKDLIETEKNLAKIEHYDEEKKEKEEMKKMGGMNMGMDGGYSQRKFYIDADYMPYGQPFPGGGSYGQGGSYARGGGNSRAGGQGGQGGGSSRMGGNYSMYDMGGSYADGGNSYNMYYDPRYEQPPMYAMAGGSSYARGYSRNDKQSTIEELQQLMNSAQDAKVKEAIQKTINEMNK